MVWISQRLPVNIVLNIIAGFKSPSHSMCSQLVYIP